MGVHVHPAGKDRLSRHIHYLRAPGNRQAASRAYRGDAIVPNQDLPVLDHFITLHGDYPRSA